MKQQVNGNTIYSVYDRSGALVHLDAVTAGEKTDYIAGPQGTLARIKNNVITYLHHDILGSAQSGTNSSGVVQWREQYSPFGEELQGISANADQAGYTGHIRDAATGLNYMQARYYDPVIGRFLSNDPVDALSHLSSPNGIYGFNRYAYANNNPYKYVDPDGQKVHCLLFGIKSVAVCAVAGIAGVHWGVSTLRNAGEHSDNLDDLAESARGFRRGEEQYMETLKGTIKGTASAREVNEAVDNRSNAQRQLVRSLRETARTGSELPGTTRSGPIPTSIADLAITGAVEAIQDIAEGSEAPKKREIEEK